MNLGKIAIFTLVCSMVGGAGAVAQNNLVPNSSFEQIIKKPKKGKEIEYAEPWVSPSAENKADLYSSRSKKEYGVPDNKYGNLNADDSDDGGNYIGLRLYSYKEREPRTYAQVKLSSAMIAGKAYCISFKVALAKTSKYATNNIGLYASVKKAKEKEIVGYKIKPQVKHSKNRVFDEQFTFETICGIYKAKGNERYITIGNFAPQTSMVLKKDIMKIKRPRGMTKQQTPEAYYYIDQVSVINMQELESCQCEKGDGNEMQVVYSENVSDDMDMSIADQVSLKKVYFESNSKTASSPRAIIEIIRTMKENPNMKIQVVGHCDKKEAESLDDISAERAKAIMDYLVSKGIPAANLSSKGVKYSKPIDESGTKEGNAKNRRVEFKVL